MGKKQKLLKMAQELGRLQQVAALPYRIKDDAVEFLVITSRRRKRLIVPKGWPMSGFTDAEAAATEADEEAGVRGKVEAEPFATFGYMKEIGDQRIPIDAAVFTIKVKRLKADYKERKERKRKWLSAEDAADKLNDSGLRSLVARYAEKLRASRD